MDAALVFQPSDSLAEAHGFDLFEAMDREVKRILHVPIALSRQKQIFKANAGIARLPGTLEQEEGILR